MVYVVSTHVSIWNIDKNDINIKKGLGLLGGIPLEGGKAKGEGDIRVTVIEVLYK
jgi:hypothetical protein